MEVSRRAFLVMIAGSLVQPDQPVKQGMTMRSRRPEDLEMPLEGFSEYLTPIDRFFVRSHTYVPKIALPDWRLTVQGEIATPLTLGFDEVRQLPATELVSVLECAGNGRGFYEPSVAGLQWLNGAVGNARWKGVRLADLLKRAGVKSTAAEVLFEGADAPLGTMPDFQRSVPIGKALDPNTLLAYEMNGQTLPVAHGHPLRLVSPGWAGDSWVKWLTSIQVLSHEHDGFWMKSAYRQPGYPVRPGSVIPPDQMRPVTSLRIKSVITSPRDDAAAPLNDVLTVRGVAWAGDAAPVAGVDVSVDNGRRWQAATLKSPQRTRFGWQPWEFAWTPARAGYYTILARARDGAGDTQPMEQEWNPSGYGWNVAPRVSIAIGMPPRSASPPPQNESATGAEPPVLKRTCGTCHDDDVIRQQRLSREQWERELNKMTGWGARVGEQDRGPLLDFLSSTYGVRPRPR
jgi:DMSO/TMAO reductase YedYZ molybdopterin-dependent catalytic subunit